MGLSSIQLDIFRGISAVQERRDGHKSKRECRVQARQNLSVPNNAFETCIRAPGNIRLGYRGRDG